MALTGVRFFSGSAALELEGEHTISPGDEPGARLILSRARSSPCSAQALKLVWAHSPPSQPAKEFVPGKRGPALGFITKGIPVSRGGERSREQAKGSRRSLGEGRVPGAES